ncbi:MAG TPA: ester cyclase [Thermoplasmata archaeon]|nr:ester cyclase [Thermoplasmata archaeon]
MIAVVNTRNVEKVLEHYAEDATFQVPNLETPLKGKVAIRSYLTENFVAFPDYTIEVSKVFVQGNDVVVVDSVSGTHTGPLMAADGTAIVPSNKKFVQEQMTRLVLNQNGKVQSLRSYGNAANLHPTLAK